MMQPKELPLDQAAEYIGVTPKTLYMWRSKYKNTTDPRNIPAMPIGRTIRYKIAVLDRFKEKMTQGDEENY